eukprot:5949631-Heterocapsa_arctica.AAC.1
MEYEGGQRLSIYQIITMQISNINEKDKRITCNLTDEEREQLQGTRETQLDRQPRPSTRTD